jgi:hypothetical protein
MEFVGAGDGGGGGLATDLSADSRQNNPANTNAKQVPTTFFITSKNSADVMP